MQKLILFSVSIVIFMLSACTQESNEIENLDFSDLDFSSVSFDFDFSQPVTFDRSEVSLDELASEIYESLFADDSGLSYTKNHEQHLEGFDINISPTTITINPIPSSDDDVDYSTGDDKKCGGSDGDGWTNRGTCTKESCVQEKIAQAAAEEGAPGPGKCLDLRVRRTTFHARVCSRIVDC